MSGKTFELDGSHKTKCIFCAIVNDEVPSHKICEDENIIAL